ncbi:MAG: TRAP transporter large permease [Alphaproteobacteria bacterium]|nr:TRAP transporter large permease [Alphaproteobacteria bacterium]
MTGTVFFWIFLASLSIGTPVVFSLAFGPIVQFLMVGNEVFYKMVPQRIFSGIDLFPLLAIPLFVLAGEIMNVGGITQRLVRFAVSLVGHLRGGLAHVNIISLMLISGVSGSAVADATAVGSILIPAMQKQGYSLKFAAAVTCSGAVLGPIIPPSIIMVIYGFAMQLNVAALFLAGFLPGVMIAAGLMAVIMVISRKRNYPMAERRATFREIATAGFGALLPLMTPIIIIGGILMGVVTPTESAAAACVYALVLSIFVMRTLKWSDVPPMLYRTGLISGTILFIIGAAQLFGWLATITGIPQLIGKFVAATSADPLLLMFYIQILLFITGMFLDAVPSILILGPILEPVATQIGVDRLHFAIVMCINLSVGLATPPMGMLLFVTSGMTKLGIETISKEMLPFFALYIGVIALMAYVPWITLVLPKMLGVAY